MGVRHSDVVVIGAGIQGACIAFALAERGIACTVLEQEAGVMTQASTHNEGRIHLGLIYPMDPTGRTAPEILRAGLEFAPILRRWVGPGLDALAPSTPLWFCIERDSLMSVEALEAFYEDLSAQARALLNAPGARLDYMGARPQTLARRLPREVTDRWIRSDRFQGVFEVAERTYPTVQMAPLVRDALQAHPLIDLRCGCKVREAALTEGGARLAGDGPDGAFELHARQVANATWDEIYVLDDMAGLPAPAPWIFRLKYRVIGRAPERLRAAPSTSLVQGPYGDAVIRSDGTLYATWYPHSIRGWTQGKTVPEDWRAACRAPAAPELADRVARDVLTEVEDWLPGALETEVLNVDAGVILAHGATDVDDPDSGLHRRTTTGVESLGCWHSVNPGKLTKAPRHGLEAAEAIASGLGLAGRAA
ncbi:MAG: FAD-dependent oxidoreductase [Pseudomonadota bacterium]